MKRLISIALLATCCNGPMSVGDSLRVVVSRDTAKQCNQKDYKVYSDGVLVTYLMSGETDTIEVENGSILSVKYYNNCSKDFVRKEKEAIPGLIWEIDNGS